VAAEAFASGRVTATSLADGSGVFLNIGTLEVAQVDPTGMWIVEALTSGANDIRSLSAAFAFRCLTLASHATRVVARVKP
jgi:hypothetical protein